MFIKRVASRNQYSGALALSMMLLVLPVRRIFLASITVATFCLASNASQATEQLIPERGVVDRLMNMLYGEPRQDGIRIWQVPINLAVNNPQGMPGISAEVRPLIAQAYHQRAVDKFLLVTAISDPESTCHSCRVLIDAANFERVGDEWRLRAASHGLTMAGTFGKAPKTEFRRLGPDEFGFALTDSFGAQGGTEIHFSLYRQSKSGFDLVLAADTVAQSHPFAVGPDDTPTANPVCDEVDYTFQPSRSTTNGLFDLLVLIQMGARSVHVKPGGAGPCDTPIERSPNYRKLRTRAVFSGATYCQKESFQGVRPALRLCDG